MVSVLATAATSQAAGIFIAVPATGPHTAPAAAVEQGIERRVGGRGGGRRLPPLERSTTEQARGQQAGGGENERQAAQRAVMGVGRHGRPFLLEERRPFHAVFDRTGAVAGLLSAGYAWVAQRRRS